MDRALSQIEIAIKRGNTENVKAEINALLSNRSLLCNMGGKCIAHELIIYACKYKRKKILNFLLYESNYLSQLKNTRFQEQQEDKQRIEAFYYAMCDSNMNMLTMLYNYWRDVTHEPIQSPRVNKNNIGLISRLDNVLDEAKAKCKLQLILDQNMKVNVQSFIKFMKFQLSIYKQLDVNKSWNPIENIKTVLGEYKTYKEIVNVRLPIETSDEDELTAMEQLSDKSTLYPEMYYHYLYDEYYKKLDCSTALLILDQLHLIKKKYNTQNKDIYHQIECTIFYYIWRVSENWILYLPSNPTIDKQECEIKNKENIIPAIININRDKFDNAPVIFLERLKFENCLMNMLTCFNTNNYHDNNNNPFDTNYLKHLPYMRDFYSLKKSIEYITAVENDTNFDVLCIQRALMVFGEMTKSSPESTHLSDIARALLEAGISVETMQLMIYIRNNIAKADEGKLNKRIQIDTPKNEKIFRGIQNELKEINKHIKSVVEIYESILNKTMVQHGLDLIQERIAQWSPDAKKHMDYIYKSLGAKGIDRDMQFAEIIKITGLTYNFVIEIECTLINRKILQDKLKKLQDHSVQLAKREQPKYISFINDSLNGMGRLDATKGKTLQSIQNVLKFFSDTGAFEHHIHQIVLVCIYDIQRVLDDIEPQQSAEQSISKLIYTIGNNIPMNKTSFNKIKELNRLFITNTYSDLRTERLELLSDLKDRVQKLKEILEYHTRPTIKQLWTKYMKDHKFRLSFEMVLSDIFNVFSECSMYKLLYKADKMLTSVNLRVVLAHGDPILEILGDALDPNDFPTTLLEKAMAVAEAGPSIEALYNLFRENILPQIIKSNQTNKLNNIQKRWLSEFRACPDRDTYVNLIIINKKGRKVAKVTN